MKTFLSTFITYIALWRYRRRSIKKVTGIDPEVFVEASSPLQKYFAQFIKFITIILVILIIPHSLGIQYYSMFSHFPPLDYFQADLIGFVIGLFGLAICAIAQRTMANSWRVGIDEINKTKLITTGIFRYSRNPTYLGLVILIAGVWLIWPTWTIATFVILFYFFLEIQVRCEEEYLLQVHGDKYREYCSMTSRYFALRRTSHNCE